MSETGTHTSPSYDLAKAEADYPVWVGPPKRTILLCSHPRSGSTLLGEAMYFSGSLGCPLEYLHVGFRPAFAERWQCDDLHSYIDAVKRFRTGSNGTLAIKLFWRDVCEIAIEADPVQFADMLDELPENTPLETYQALAALLASFFSNISTVHLRRLDRVRQAVSSCIATDSGVWRLPPTGRQSQRGEPHYDFDRIDSLIGYADFCHGHWRNLFSVMGPMPFAITYEKLASDYNASVTELFQHLGCDVPPPPQRLAKQADVVAEAMTVRFLREKASRLLEVSPVH
jgi:LPS sulfotransferase NodH